MKKTLAIIGCGDLGQQIAHYAISDGHYDKVVFFDDFTEEKTINGFQILGNCDSIENEYKHSSFDELLIGIGYKHLDKRKSIFERFEGTIPFGRIIHSSCWVDPTAVIHAGCVIYPSCCIDAHAVVGINSVLNISCSIAHDTVIGAHCFLSPRVALAGFVQIESQCILGINCTIIDTITVLSKTQIGGGTVVIADLKKSGLYVGNPHRFIR